jgi:hypothetical protein
VPPAARRTGVGTGWWVLALALLLLAALGVVGLLALRGRPAAAWGYTAATLAFLLSTAQAAPPLALTSRLGHGHWGVPARRAADVLALSGLVTTPLAIVLLGLLPDWRGRSSIWLDWPGAPRLWDALAYASLLLVGLALVGLSSRPDRRWRLGPAWRGTPRQWRVLGLGCAILGSLYLMLLVFAHLLTSSDLAMSLVPGWASANFPAFHVVSGLEGGVATTVLLLAALRRFGGLGERIPRRTFHACGRLLLALALLWFYFTWSELLTYWYGRTPAELDLLALLMFGPTLPLFLAAAALSFLAPVLLLMWNPIRAGVAGPTLASALIVVGTFVDRVRVYVPAWAVAGPVRDRLAELPPLPPPGVPDWLVMLGVPASALLLVLLALRALPAISLWEEGEARLLEAERPYLRRARVDVIAKPS